ncbi:hypothetical protein CMI37_21665 [Candidatus Pacearchaeota archaeon]|nr:hypothetical protein [Candidatus Pacearchaeota archaeon]
MRFTAKIENGKIRWHDETGLAEHLNMIDSQECYIDIKPSKIRNTAQNNYYWSILREFGGQIGYQPEEIHYWCKRNFKIETTSEFTIEEFSDYIDRVILWAAVQGFPVKDPRSTRLP